MRLSAVLPMAASLLAVATTMPVLADDTDGFQTGSVLLRARALDVDPSTSSNVAVVGGTVHASNNVVPEVDGSYFFTPNLAAELIAAVTYHSVKDVGSIAGTVPLGSVRLLPPTLTAQWHFFPTGTINPYVGAGVNYTFFYGVKNSSLPIIYSTHYSDSFGEAVQAGVDIKIARNLYINIDAKKLFLETDVHLGTAVGGVLAKVSLDPWLIGAGIGYRF